MIKNFIRATPEVIVLWFFLAGSVLGLVFLSALVAPPKMLLGRSLTAIMPALFPGIILALMAVLCAIQIYRLSAAPETERDAAMSGEEWRRGIFFFAVMTFYALTMEPFGFFVSTAIATTIVSVQMGNKSVWQIALIAILGPVVLYLAATRLLAVSLPELNFLELLYSRMLGE